MCVCVEEGGGWRVKGLSESKITDITKQRKEREKVFSTECGLYRNVVSIDCVPTDDTATTAGSTRC